MLKVISCVQKSLRSKILHSESDALSLTLTRKCSVDVSKEVEKIDPSQGISKAMVAYMNRYKEEEKFMTEQIAQFEIGKRHLANMMGEDPDTFTQEDIDNAIAYLLPSGLYDSKARPSMRHPQVIFPKSGEAQFDYSGRPHHSLFYTGRCHFYQLLQEISTKANRLDAMIPSAVSNEEDNQKHLALSQWISKDNFEKATLERITDDLYKFFIRAMERLMEHPRFEFNAEKDFVMKFREIVKSEVGLVVPKPMYTDAGIPYMTAQSKRKTATAEVTVYGQGSGKIEINGQGILYFQLPQDRETILFPLQMSKMLGKVDIVATVRDGGTSGQSGAIRFCTAKCLQSFVDELTREKMRIAGLLTHDHRTHERQKPGQWGARRKFTWVAR